MAPIPEDDKQNLPEEDSEIDMFSNPNLSVAPVMSDSSDENEDNIADTAGYTLLAQEPGQGDDSDDDDSDEDFNNETAQNGHGDSERYQGSSFPVGSPDLDNQILETLPDTVIQSEAGASAPTVAASSSSHHPQFLAKFPDGKVPSYMQIPSVQSDSKELLWNQRRQEKSTISLDLGQESKILKVMAGFSLPSDNVPDWARNLSEDNWRQHVLQKLSPDTKSVTLPGETDDKTSTHQQQSLHQETQLDATETGSDWVATFPDS